MTYSGDQTFNGITGHSGEFSFNFNIRREHITSNFEIDDLGIGMWTPQGIFAMPQTILSLNNEHLNDIVELGPQTIPNPNNEHVGDIVELGCAKQLVRFYLSIILLNEFKSKVCIYY